MKTIKEIKLENILESKMNLQTHEDASQEFANEYVNYPDSIFDPILVRPINEDQYEIIDGHLRYRTLKENKHLTIDCIVYDGTEVGSLKQALIRTKRGEPDPIAFGKVCKTILELDDSYSNIRLAREIGCTEGTIRNWITYYETSMKVDGGEIFKNLRIDQINNIKGFEKWLLVLIKDYLLEVEYGSINNEQAYNNAKNLLDERQRKQVESEVRKWKSAVKYVSNEIISLNELENQIEELQRKYNKGSWEEFKEKYIDDIVFTKESMYLKESTRVSEKVIAINQCFESYEKEVIEQHRQERLANVLKDGSIIEEVVDFIMRKENKPNNDFTESIFKPDDILNLASLPSTVQQTLLKGLHISAVRRDFNELLDIHNEIEQLRRATEMVNQYIGEGDHKRFPILNNYSEDLNEEYKKKSQRRKMLYEDLAVKSSESSARTQEAKKNSKNEELASEIINLLRCSFSEEEIRSDTVSSSELSDNYDANILEDILTNLQQIFKNKIQEAA